MRKYVNSEASQHEMKLIQMGADVEQINSKMCYVKFIVDGIKISYVYNINKRNCYYLERIKPYKIPVKEFQCIEDVIKIIEIDIKQFRNAAKSKNIQNFININNQINSIHREYEDLFLYYNVKKEELEKMQDKLKDIHEEIINTRNKSERIFFEKDPEHL